MFLYNVRMKTKRVNCPEVLEHYIRVGIKLTGIQEPSCEGTC